MSKSNTIHIDSIFQIKGGCKVLFYWLHLCGKKGLTVVFDTEGITVKPYDDSYNLKLMWYAFADNPEIHKMILDYEVYMERSNAGLIPHSIGLEELELLVKRGGE